MSSDVFHLHNIFILTCIETLWTRDQTVPYVAVGSGYTLFATEASKMQPQIKKQTTKQTTSVAGKSLKVSPILREQSFLSSRCSLYLFQARIFEHSINFCIKHQEVVRTNP